MQLSLALLAMLPLVASACEEKHVTADVAAANAAVPASLRTNLEFVSADIPAGGLQSHDDVWTMAIPKTWTIDRIGQRVAPTSAGAQGKPFMSLNTRPCALNQCSPDRQLENATIVDRKETTFARNNTTVRRLVVRTREDDGESRDAGITIYVFWWIPGEWRYHACAAFLSAELAGADGAFEKACESVIVHGN